MAVSVVITALTCAALISAVLLKCKVKVFGRSFEIYPLIPLLGGVLVILFGTVGIRAVVEKFTSSAASNPVKIIVLFISMSLMSVLLDETGFFEYIAGLVAKKAGESQIRIFIALYLTVSVLTVFTSNDVVILTFTPFICQFCKKTEIDPLPYLVSEFVGANTWSLLFLIGNPTNVFLSQAYGISFGEYFLRMWLPTLFCGISSLLALLAIFWKKLKKPVYRSVIDIKLKDKKSALISLCFLFITTLLIAIASYIDLEMWYIALIMAVLQYLTVFFVKLFSGKNESGDLQSKGIIGNSLKRAPWQMIPLVVGMFIMVTSLVETSATKYICGLIGDGLPITKYGILSTLVSNLTNNIPMSVLFSSITAEIVNTDVLYRAVYATVIGSNVGAFLSPLGALAGLMFISIAKKYYNDFGFVKFVKYGSVIAVISLVFGLIGLHLSFLLF